MTIKFGTFTLSQVPDLNKAVDTLADQFQQFILAEELGFHSVWCAEHLFSNQAIVGSTQILAGAIARATKRVRIGTAVNIIPYNHPLRTASDFALVDNMSNGRLNYGAGRAYQAGEFRALGIDINKSREMYREGLDIILTAWRGEPFSYEGKFWNIPDPVSVFPRVVQKPLPPVFAAVQTPESFIEAGRRGFHLLMAALIACRAKRELWIEDLATNLQLYEQAAREAGHDPSTLERCLMIPAHVARGTDEAADRYRPCVNWAVLASNKVKRSQEAADYALSMDFDTLQGLGAVVTSDPAGTIAQLRLLKEKLGLTEFLLEFNKGGLADEQVRASMTMFANEVLPFVEDSSPTSQGNEIEISAA